MNQTSPAQEAIAERKLKLTLAGRGGFDFTVTNAAGSAGTQRFAICSVNSLEPSDLVWRGNGAATANWDTTTTNWNKAGAPIVFAGGDRVTFDATGSASATVSVPGSVVASAVEVTAAASYTLSGAGSVNTTGTLTKRGTGTLTIANSAANSFGGGLVIEQGTLAVNAATGVGSSKITAAGGALAFGAAANSTVGSTSATLEITAPTTITPTTQHSFNHNWSGTDETVTFSGGSVLWSVGGTWTDFSGRLRFGSGSTKLRLNNAANFGSAAVAIDLGSNNAQFMNRNGSATTPFDIGSLEATGANTQLIGTQTSAWPPERQPHRRRHLQCRGEICPRRLLRRLVGLHGPAQYHRRAGRQRVSHGGELHARRLPELRGASRQRSHPQAQRHPEQ